jgi:ribonucleoside-diphosphate reductase alpha chain
MVRVQNNESWSLFDPDECPGLTDVYGDDYRKLYTEYESKKLYREQIPAREIWKAVFVSQKESGIPYILYKDHVNRNNNQSNIGVVKSSNLCVTGDTIILTDKGHFPIQELVRSNPVHNVWNGEEFTPATFAKTGENQPLMQITVRVAKKEVSNVRLSQLQSDEPLGILHYNTRVLKCTPYHKFILEDESVVEAQDLTKGAKLLDWYHPHGNFQVYSYIAEIEHLSEREDTYCFNEPKKHRGVFNSILTQNCSEIVEVSNSEEYACCTLASICLSVFVEDTLSEQEPNRPLNHEFPSRPVFNYKKLIEVVQVIVRNLNQVIDRNWYPTPETERSNLNHRPLGIGVQGLADVFYKFKCTYDSSLARELNQRIFETIYYAAISASTKLAREIHKSYIHQLQSKPSMVIDKKEYTLENLPKTIGSYPSMLRKDGSPLFKGQFHWELYGLKPEQLLQKFDWESLRAHIQTFGIRNSLLIALMPTASTSQIMGNIESIEPLTSNVFKRQTLAGEFIVINKYLMHDLNQLGLWNTETENFIKLNNGSIQNIEGIPEHIKHLYRTVWEISQQHIIDLAADRQPFVDQSQSMNLFIEDLSFSKFNSMHFYGWNKKLKTGCYYLRTRPAVQAQKFTVVQPATPGQTLAEFSIPTQNEEEICLVCSS